MIVWGAGEGLGNHIQMISAIQCLKDVGLYIFCTANGSWPSIHRVMDLTVSGYVKGDNENIKHFLKSCWYRGPLNEKAITYQMAYRAVNQVQLHWEVAEQFYSFNYQKQLPKFKPARLGLEPSSFYKKKYLAIHPAKTLSSHWDYKLYKYWKELVIEIKKDHEVAIVGTNHDVIEMDLSGLVDYRNPLLPLDHARFLQDHCYGLITSASGWAFLGAAIPIETFVLWGPDSLKRNRPLGDNIHILKNGDCQECFNVDKQPTSIPKCQINNQCMDFKPKEVLNEVEKLLHLQES